MVPERFYQDWALEYSWQQNRGIVGHNCKIVWNLHRVANFFKKRGGSAFADELVENVNKLLDVSTAMLDQLWDEKRIHFET